MPAEQSNNAKPTGFKISLGGSKKNLLAPVKKTGAPPAKRPRLALDDDEPEDTTTHVEISGWDTAGGGAIDKNGKGKEEEKPRVIAALPNRMWREGTRRTQDQQAQKGESEGNGDKHEESKIVYGLTVVKKAEPQHADGEAMEVVEETKQPVDDGLTEEQRLEKQALDALVNGKPTGDQSVIPVVPQTEDEAFSNDYHTAPDAPSLDAYEATPIEGFGAALLRGMGWKDGQDIGRNKGTAVKPREIKRRSALLGIGAKEEAAVGVEIGAWGGGKGKGKRMEQSYNPVILKNKQTGELISQEELKAKMEQQALVQDDKEKRKDKYDNGYNSEDERRRERRRKEKRDRDRDRDRSADRYSRPKEKDRRQHYAYSDDDRDDRRRREKHRRREVDPDDDREERRRKDRRRENDYYDSDRKRDKQRDRKDRDRSRSRDSTDSRKRRRDYDDERDDRKRRYREDRRYRT